SHHAARAVPGAGREVMAENAITAAAEIAMRLRAMIGTVAAPSGNPPDHAQYFYIAFRFGTALAGWFRRQERRETFFRCDRPFAQRHPAALENTAIRD